MRSGGLKSRKKLNKRVTAQRLARRAQKMSERLQLSNQIAQTQGNTNVLANAIKILALRQRKLWWWIAGGLSVSGALHGYYLGIVVGWW